MNVNVWGDWIPRSLFGKFHTAFAVLRMLWVTLWVIFSADVDVAFVDQISFCIPFLKLGGVKVLFYCHYPDKLLSKPGSLAKKLYRIPLDFLEEKTTGTADVIVTNSKFTSSVVRKHFPSIKKELEILYPTTYMSKSENKGISKKKTGKKYFLSINRYEKKKKLELAVHAFASLIKETGRDDLELVLVGGYDERVEENKLVFDELYEIVNKEKISSYVKLLKNATQQEKLELIENCLCLVYTPEDEHFGIVPLEAMALGKPVIASDSGGPRETVEDNVTGFLCAEHTAKCFAEAMIKLVDDDSTATKMGDAGEQRVKTLFGPKAFTKNLSRLIEQAVSKQKEKKN